MYRLKVDVSMAVENNCMAGVSVIICWTSGGQYVCQDVRKMSEGWMMVAGKMVGNRQVSQDQHFCLLRSGYMTL